MTEKRISAEPEIYVGKGNASMQDDYIDFINYVFGFSGEKKDFYKLLPKLYRKEYDPAGHSYVVTENGKLKAAVGAFPHEIDVCGHRLLCRGIGNVAVHPFSRSKGYMKQTMNAALDDMVKDGVDLSILGGARARYNYFSFEREGTTLHFKLSPDAIRHHFGKDRKKRFTYHVITPSDTDALNAIAALSDAQLFHPIRERERLYDILTSWHAVPVAVYDGERFVGYVVCGDEAITEALTVNSEDYLPMIVGAYDEMGNKSLTVSVAPFRPDQAAELYRVCEGYDMMCSKMYSVLSYERVVRAFLCLKATYETLPDGELTISVHGRAGDEALLISVKNGEPSVEKTDRTPDITLDHIDAMNLIFAPICPARAAMPHHVRAWFPLPLYMYLADVV